MGHGDEEVGLEYSSGKMDLGRAESAFEGNVFDVWRDPRNTLSNSV